MKEYEIKIYNELDENTVCLPVVFPPPIKCYLPISIIANIATANMNNLNWIMHNFVQLFKYTDVEKLESFPVQHFMYANQASISCKEITNEVMSIERINIIDEIIYCIDHKHYIVVYLDENMIPGMRFYQRREILHSQFIFGYNRQKKIFKTINFSNTTAQMEVIDVPFSIISNLFYSEHMRNIYKKQMNSFIRDKGYQIYALLYSDELFFIDTSLNIEVIKDQLKQYLYAKDSSVYTTYFTGSLSGKWGLDVYEEIERMLLKQIDMRMVCLLYEHKIFMQYRIQYLDIDLAKEYSPVVRFANKLKMYCLKCIIRNMMPEASEIANPLHEMKTLEQKILARLLVK